MPENYSNLTLKEIKFAQWLLLKRPLFKRLLILFLIGINVIIWGIAIYHFSLILIYQKAYQETIEGLTKNWLNFYSYHQLNEPSFPIISDQNLIYIGPDPQEPIKSRYDFIVAIENPNDKWYIRSIEGQFSTDGQIINAKTESFGPFEKKYLFALNQITEGRIGAMNFEITHINWQRLRPGMREKLDILKNLVFEEVRFIPSSVIEQKIAPARIQFKAINKSAYSFWQVNVQIAIYQGSKIVDFYILPIKKWLANQTQSIELTLLKPLNFASDIKMVIDINPLDENIFIKP
jgi:hypothetical protein